MMRTSATARSSRRNRTSAPTGPAAHRLSRTSKRGPLARSRATRSYLLRRFERERLDFLAGTLAPARRASERPIAIACFRLLTFLPERPDLSVPAFRSRIAFPTVAEAFLPYARAMREILTGPTSAAISKEIDVSGAHQRRGPVVGALREQRDEADDAHVAEE